MKLKMTNPKIRNITGNIFYWHIRTATLKKTSSKPFDRAYGEVEWPITCQISFPIDLAIYDTILKHR